MIYEDYATISELHRWSLEHDIAWEEIDREAALSQPEILDQLRESALIEALHPISTNRLLGLLWDDLDATSILSVELFEGFRHFRALERYLQAVGHQPPITAEEVVEARRKAMAVEEDLTAELVNFIFSEHFAAYYFVRLSQGAADPVLRSLALHIARDEFRHTQISYELLRQRIDQDQESAERVLAAAAEFRHYGQALGDVPVFQRNDLQAIRAFMKKVEALTGTRLVDYLKERIPE